MKRVLSVSFGVFIVMAAIIGGVVIAKDVVKLREIETSITKQQDLQTRVFDEKAKLRDKVQSEKKRMSEIPDSLEATKSGLAVKSSMVIAKMEARLDQDNARIKRILRELERNQMALKERIKIKGVIVAGLEILLIAGLIVVRRFVG